MTHLLAYLLPRSVWRLTARNTSSQSFVGATGDDKFELDLPSDGDDAVQLEQSEDEGFSLQDKQTVRFLETIKRPRSNFIATPASMTSNVPRRPQRPRARTSFFVLGK